MGRRGHNEGTITRRADGRWEAKLSLGYRNGKRVRKAYYGATRQDVQRKLRDALKARDDGLPLASDDRLTVESYLNRWLAAKRPNIRPGTYRQFEWLVRVHLIPALGHHKLKELQPADVQLAFARKSSVSTQTVHHMRAILRMALNQAMRWGMLARNVATLIEIPELERPEIHPLSAEQVRVLLDHWREDQYGALYATAALLGVRQGEALGLLWSDVDLNAGKVKVTKTATGRTKTRASVRTLTIPPSLVAILREHRDTGVRSIEGYVFPGRTGGPLNGTNVTHRFQAFLRRLGLPRIRFHDLRHSYATIMLARGVHPKKVADAMGHATTALFMQTYAHWTEGIAGEVAAEMEAAVSR